MSQLMSMKALKWDCQMPSGRGVSGMLRVINRTSMAAERRKGGMEDGQGAVRLALDVKRNE